MNSWSIEIVVKAVHGQILSQKEDHVCGVGTDTRANLKNNLFIALRGEQFDAHKFLSSAFDQGASALLVDQAQLITEELKARGTVILVKDTLQALQDLARWHRTQMPTKVVGITGSVGKTSTKEFLAAILQGQREVFYSKGSLNNHWGVPLSLLGIEPKHQIALIEMGMNHAGEITTLVGMAQPDIVLCTTVGAAHIEHFGSVDKIAEAKEEIYLAAAPEAVRIFNIDNPWTQKMYTRAVEKWPQGLRMTFSENKPEAEVSFRVIEMTLESLTIEGRIGGYKFQQKVPVFGVQNSINLMAAATGALACGLKGEEIGRGLAHCRTTWGRNQLLRAANNAVVLFDAYNANPDSMAALLNNISQLKSSSSSRKIGVFAEMLEMGEASSALHEELGAQVGRVNFSEVYFYGKPSASFAKGFHRVNSETPLHCQEAYTPELALQLSQNIRSEDLIFVKGSRGMKMERMIQTFVTGI